MIFAGDPTNIHPSGKLRVTTEFAPTIHPSPKETPCKIETFSPIQTFFPICISSLTISLLFGGISMSLAVSPL